LTINLLDVHDDDMDEAPWFDDVVMPALLGSARATYGMAMRRALADAGFDDVPPRGMAVIGGIARNGPFAQQDVGAFLDVSKQAAGQLLDTLVTRGYVRRALDPDDRRRMVVSLTPRGEEAAVAQAAGVARVESGLARHVSASDLATARRVLGTLVDIGQRARARRRAELSGSSDHP
jgi:DNA-binding MarR family transcriptional regulator